MRNFIIFLIGLILCLACGKSGNLSSERADSVPPPKIVAAPQGDGVGNCGDPTQFDLYHRAQYLAALAKVGDLDDLVRKLPPSFTAEKFLAEFNQATTNLLIEPDSRLPRLGEVVWDPIRKRKVVKVNPIELEKVSHSDALDLNQWLLHEILQTIACEECVSKTLDREEEFLRDIRFTEFGFKNWHATGNTYGARILKPELRNASYASSRIEVELQSQGSQVFIAFAEVEGRVLAIPLFKDEKSYVADSARSLLGKCFGDVEIEVTPTVDGFYWKEKAGDCIESQYFHLSRRGLVDLYRKIEQATYHSPKQLPVFSTVIGSEPGSIGINLMKVVDSTSKDWRGRTPPMLAAWFGKRDVLESLLKARPNLALEKDSDGKDLIGYASGNHPEVSLGDSISVLQLLMKLPAN